MSAKHEFAIYFPDLPSVTVDFELKIYDKEVVRRIYRVLRLQKGDSCILFDRYYHAHVLFVEVTKNVVQVKVKSVEENKQLEPRITALLPLLKRSYLEDAVYNLAELGVNEIQLVVSEKVQRKWGGQKELERLHKIVVAAAEQSKYFAFPEIKKPVMLEEAVGLLQGARLYCDPGGELFFDVIIELKKNIPSKIGIMVGPEGDLTDIEKDLLHQSNFKFVKLTPTVLRARQAATIACGILRVFL